MVTEAKKNGSPNYFYDNMKKVVPGDIVFSFAGGEVRAVGVVTNFASEAPKPSEFGLVGTYWNDNGWFVPVEFKRVRKPLRPKDHMDVIAPLLPEKYSPIQSNGNGNQGAYLSSISEDMGVKLLSLLDLDEVILVDHLKSVNVTIEIKNGDERAEEDLKRRTDISETEKKEMIKARRGQGIFRANVESIEEGCRVTGLKLKTHLRASHIKPWRCSSNNERLDGNNGLLLAPHVDHLFDKGFISFDENGKILISTRLDPLVLETWKIDRSINIGKFTDPQLVYLEFHRASVFQHD